ncbi:glycosyltransferase family 2 protein [Segetibacter sp.]|uniref:glycosyltransferase family 2 protein n=1 Tax=Segetibacter sp. TaxID=2231182 RepID=UPI00263805F5|nr:glycosyltransferase family 2 protein [Segetibacter sp.]MCW3081095.1 glycosyltransferase [Segetibacter sp.]
MQLSVIIVNYNVKYFLEQCLCSLFAATEQIDAEVWVIDNASTDGSIDYLKPKFPRAFFIANAENVGFAKANNQILENCKGDLVLFLNPDTILPEDCLTTCIEFMRNAAVGGLGIRMIDGSGKFLPESKRSFPTPLTAFYKLIGLSSLFPSSKTFSRYSLAYLDQYKNHEVDVLAGAFLLSRKEILVELNGFDEAFFMYGEDIDLSFRIQKLGYKNVYFSESTIVHFKGESTRKGSLNYVKMFYLAMSVFVKKHYTGASARVFAFFIHVAIWLRAAVAALVRFVLRIGMPLLDAVIIYASFKITNYCWVKYVREGQGFVRQLVDISLPGFTLVFLATATLAGIYDNKYRPLKAVYAAFIAIVVNLAVYSLLPEKYRFSRGVILIGGFIALLLITFVRWILIKTRFVEDDIEDNKLLQTIIVGSNEEFSHVKELFTHAGWQERIIGRVAVNGDRRDALGTIDELVELIGSSQVREIIFCEGYLTYKAIISLIQKVPNGISVRFYSAKTDSIVGSDSKNRLGEYVSAHPNFAIKDEYQKRMKRIVDVFVATLLLITFPIQIVLLRYNWSKNAIAVLLGKKTWVGYLNHQDTLPSLIPGTLSVTGNPAFLQPHLTKDAISKLDYLYAKNYDWKQDITIILGAYKKFSLSSKS